LAEIDPRPDDEIPAAIESPRRSRWSAAQAIWLIPLLAVGIVGWLALNEWLSSGPTITIRFRSAEGIEAGKTRVKYRDVDLGVVKQVRLAPDRKGVVVVAQMEADARPLLAEDTRFWIVRARLSGGEVSGLSTLLSGSYIGIDGGRDGGGSRRDFEGLETPPVLSSDESGREFSLSASTLGSLEVGSPIFLRRVRVGQVLGADLDPDGRTLTLRIFVRAPYDQLVTANTRFWHASGLDVSVDAGGVRVRTESLFAVVVGGIAFETPPETAPPTPAAPGARFTLFDSQATALRRPDWQTLDYTATFTDSVRGLAVGAPVEFKGFVIGEVAAVDIEFDPAILRFVFPVKLRIYRDLAATVAPQAGVPAPAARGASAPGNSSRFPLEQLLSRRSVERGLRAQLRSSNLITGQRYVAIDFFPELRGEKLNHLASGGREIPTARDSLGELEASVSRIVKKLEAVPFDQVAADLQRTLASLDRAVRTTEQTVQRFGAELIPGARAVLDDTRRTIEEVRALAAQGQPLPQQASAALRDLSRAADALRDLAEAVERQPESLLRGRRAAPGEEVPR
jgi:paraquat-inducible protein B